MKKAKLIIPAVAILAISGAASVTGTVAWFTSATTASFSTGAVTAVAVDSALSVEHVAGFVNSKVEDSLIKQEHDINDSSFNSTDHKFYRASFNDIEGSATADASAYFEAAADVASAGAYCVSWISEFTAPGGDSYDVFFDFASTMTGDGNIAKAFRLFASEVTIETVEGAKKFKSYGTNNFVWGANTTTLKYVTGEGPAATKTGTYTDAQGKAGHNVDKANATDTQETARGNIGYLGNIPANGSLAVQFVIYCEGTDAACINDNSGQKVTSSLKFYSRNIAGYTKTGA